jgi:hypothetical protein
MFIVGLCFCGYAVFFKHTDSNVFNYEIQQQEKRSKQGLKKAMDYLKEKKYAEAKDIVTLDFMKFNDNIRNKSKTIQQENSVYDYCLFMLAADDDPIEKYGYIQFVKPIEGIVTEEQLSQYVTEWKPKSEAASANIQKQKDDALNGLSTEEQWFVIFYDGASINGKTPDPNLAATHATNGTVAQAKKKVEQWMNDPRILQAIEKYKSITIKYDANSSN